MSSYQFFNICLSFNINSSSVSINTSSHNVNCSPSTLIFENTSSQTSFLFWPNIANWLLFNSFSIVISFDILSLIYKIFSSASSISFAKTSLITFNSCSLVSCWFWYFHNNSLASSLSNNNLISLLSLNLILDLVFLICLFNSLCFLIALSKSILISFNHNNLCCSFHNSFINPLLSSSNNLIFLFILLIVLSNNL